MRIDLVLWQLIEKEFIMRKLLIIILGFALFFAGCENEENSGQTEQSKNKTSQSQIQNNKGNKDIQFKVSSEKIAEVGDIFQIKFEINADAESFNPPDFNDFDIISGPSTSSFSSVQIINGKLSKKITNSYSYSISCSKVGTFTIKSAEVTVDGQIYKSDSLQIKIIDNKASSVKNNKTSHNKKQKIYTADDIFIRTEFSKTSVYNGEFITVTTKIYTTKDFQNISEIKFPDYSGFWTKSLKEPRQIQFHNEIINGKKYSAALLKQVLLFAVKPGKYTISPYTITLQLKKKDGKVRDFFGNIADNYKLINKRLSTKKQVIVVKPLPQPAPENFSGFTGTDVSLKATTDVHSIKTDESANFKVTVSGTGNLYLLNDLPLQLPAGLKHFKPETELNDKYTEFGEVGDVTFNFIIVSDKVGNYTVPPIDFVYFDSEIQNYKTVSSQAIEISVEKGKGYTENSDKDKVLSNKDIRYIKNELGNLKKKNSGFVGSIVFYLSYFIFAILLIIIVYVRKKYLKANADIVSLKKKKAGKVSQKRLKTALQFMKANDKQAFYKEILTAIWGYLSDKLSVNSDDLTKDGIRNLLGDKNIDTVLIDKLLNITEICGYAQYSPGGEEAKPETIYKDTEEVINELEGKL